VKYDGGEHVRFPQYDENEPKHRWRASCSPLEAKALVDDAGVKVHRVPPAPDWGRMKGLWRMNRIWPGFAWAAVQRLRIINKACPVDVVEAGEGRADSFFVPSMRRFWKVKPKIVVRLHTARIIVDRLNAIVPNWRLKVEYWLEKHAILSADALTAPTRAIVDVTAR
jgi:hypothetical protein